MVWRLKLDRWHSVRPKVVLAGTVALLLVSACGTQSTPAVSVPSTPVASLPPSPTAVPTQSAAATPAPPLTLSLASSRFGKILTDGSGRTLYLFDADRTPTSTCYTACASAWPPLLMSQQPTVGPDLDQALVSTTTRNDGSKQVIYNAHPLYYYAGDPNPGDINCQAVNEFGGGWFVVDSRGNKIP